MTATNPSSAPSAYPDLTRSRTVLLAVSASVIQMLMIVPGYSEDGSLQLVEWLVVLAISLVLSVALFLFAVPNGGVTAWHRAGGPRGGQRARLLGGHHAAARPG